MIRTKMDTPQPGQVLCPVCDMPAHAQENERGTLFFHPNRMPGIAVFTSRAPFPIPCFFPDKRPEWQHPAYPASKL